MPPCLMYIHCITNVLLKSTNYKSEGGVNRGSYPLVKCLYLILCGWSAAAPRRAFLSASYSE